MNKDEKSKKLNLVYVIVVLLGGMMGGFIGILIFINYSFLDPINLTAGFDVISLKPTTKIIVEKSIPYDKILTDVKYSIVDIYDTAKNTNDGLLNIENAIYSKQFVGKGVILTSDGWIVSSNKLNKFNKKTGVISFNNGKNQTYKPIKTIEDPFSGLLFIKIEASGLPVAAMSSSNQVNDGQSIIVVGNNRINIAHVSSAKYSKIIEERDYIKSSDILNRKILINIENGSYYASPMLNIDGELIGIVEEEDSAVGISAINKAFNHILNSQNIARPSLGIEYIDLNSLAGDIKNEKGALIYNVLPNSSAFIAGLKKNDIILKIEEDEIKDNNLSELIQEYDKDDAVVFTIVRNGKQIEKEIRF